MLDQGKLSEYSNWKQRLDLHMEPIDLRMASVREARNAERRFCFEVITPHFKRVYQAPAEEDMHSWINAINNALQTAVETRSGPSSFTPSTNGERNTRDIGSVLTGKSSSYSGHHSHAVTPASGVNRRITTGSRPIYVRSDSNSLKITRRNYFKRSETTIRATAGVLIAAPAAKSNGFQLIWESCYASSAVGSTAL